MEEIEKESKKEEISLASNQTSEEKLVKPPVSVVNIHLTRLGKIFSHIAITDMIILSICVLASFLMPLAQGLFIIVLLLVMLVMILFTIGMIFTFKSNPMGRMWELFQNVSEIEFAINISNFCFSLFPYLSIIGICCSLLSIVTLACTKPQRHIGRIIAVSIIMVLMIIPLVLYYIMGGVLWQS